MNRVKTVFWNLQTLNLSSPAQSRSLNQYSYKKANAKPVVTLSKSTSLWLAVYRNNPIFLLNPSA